MFVCPYVKFVVYVGEAAEGNVTWDSTQAWKGGVVPCETARVILNTSSPSSLTLTSPRAVLSYVCAHGSSFESPCF